MKPTRTLIVIANGAKARFFVHERPDRRLTALDEMSTEIPAGSDILADRPGRTFSRVGPGRSAMEPKSDPRELKEKEFAREVVERLEGEFSNTGANRIVVVAAPRTLAEIRKHLSKQMEGHVDASLDKDLTNTPEPELIGHLADQLGV